MAVRFDPGGPGVVGLAGQSPPNVFPVALGVLLAYHIGTLTLHRVPLWASFRAWFPAL